MLRGPISRVLSRTIIYLVCTLPCSSSHATRTQAGPAHRVPICACSGWGLPSRRVATTLVVSYTTVSAFPFTHKAQVGVFFSAALSVGSLRPAVSRHPALWSPDFPHACRKRQVARSFGPLSGVNFSTARPRRRIPYKKLSNTQPIGNKTPAFFCTFAHVGTLYLIAWNGSFTKSLR